ncbi:MAG: Maf family protein [Evtepia sp.]
MTEIILASQSPRRRALLEQIGLQFHIDAPNIDEGACEGCSPAAYVAALSAEKAGVVAARHLGEQPLVIAADTVVVMGNRILGKPDSKKEAFQMLASLSGKSHLVYTGVTLQQGETVLTQGSVTEVKFRRLNLLEIKDYVETREPYDKAGGYGIQGMGALFVEEIHGDFYNVMGLPLHLVNLMLREFGVNCMHQNEDGKV